jgi:hypothetical protein
VKTFNGDLLTTLTGKELREKGFDIELEGLYSGDLFEVVIKQ